jgi:hypothetical protein
MSYTSLNPTFESATLSTGNLQFNATSGTIIMDALGAGPHLQMPGFNIWMGRNAGSGTSFLGFLNIAIGSNTLTALTNINCEGNIAIGSQALQHVGGGASETVGNTAIGLAAAQNYTSTESGNIIIGSDNGIGGEMDTIRIGNTSTWAIGTPSSTCFIQGIAGVTVASSAAVLINTTTGQMGTIPSSIRFKENINYKFDSSNVLKLKPATFTFKSDITKETHFGLIAEEVHEVMPELVLYDNENKPASVQYHELPVLLLNEIKKLHSQVSKLEIVVKTLKERLT